VSSDGDDDIPQRIAADEVIDVVRDLAPACCIDLSREKIRRCISAGETDMATARVFRSGNSQAVRLPKEYRLKGPEVEIFRRGEEIVLREKAEGLVRAFEILADLPADVLPEDRGDTLPQEREGL
jgi:antitoxin VapB